MSTAARQPYSPILMRPPREEIEYPTSDGMPMADNTLQFSWIVIIKEGFEWHFAERDDVFVAGDLLWYPVKGDNKTMVAPDTLLVFGRPKGYRGAYLQWKENNIAPQVVFEVLSANNTAGEMTLKFQFYEKHGVEEYYLYDPYLGTVNGWVRRGDVLIPIEHIQGWRSSRLQVTFGTDASGNLQLRNDHGELFVSYVEMARQLEHERTQASLERVRAEEAARHAEAEKQHAAEEKQRADAEKQRAERLAAQLRAWGIEPEG